jgi:hypothetical protein
VKFSPQKKKAHAGHWWPMPVILATQEAEIRRIKVRSQSGQIVLETLSWKKPITRKGWWSSSGVGPEFKPQYHTHTHTHKRGLWWHCWAVVSTLAKANPSVDFPVTKLYNLSHLSQLFCCLYPDKSLKYLTISTFEHWAIRMVRRCAEHLLLLDCGEVWEVLGEGPGL